LKKVVLDSAAFLIYYLWCSINTLLEQKRKKNFLKNFQKDVDKYSLVMYSKYNTENKQPQTKGN